MKAITEIDDPRLVKGLAHPLRVHILRVLEDRVASPSEIAEELDAPLGNVSYHVRFLARVGLIELSSTQPRRGAVEHYYRAAGRPQITDKAWGQVPKVIKDALIGSTLNEIGVMISDAAATGGFDREQVHVSRKTYALDEQGFIDLAAAISALLDRASDIERESTARQAASVPGEPRSDEGERQSDRGERRSDRGEVQSDHDEPQSDHGGPVSEPGERQLDAGMVMMLFEGGRSTAPRIDVNGAPRLPESARKARSGPDRTGS